MQELQLAVGLALELTSLQYRRRSSCWKMGGSCSDFHGTSMMMMRFTVPKRQDGKCLIPVPGCQYVSGMESSCSP